MDHFENAVDALDAAVFSGDGLENPANRAMLKRHCERWFRALAEQNPISAKEASAMFPPYIDFDLGPELRVIDARLTNAELMQLAFVAHQVKESKS